MSGAALYIALLVVANLTAAKLFDLRGASISVGAFAYVLCLATSDVLVDVYGVKIGYRLVALGTAANLIVLTFSQLALRIPISDSQSAFQPHFEAVLGSSASIVIASLIGYPITEAFEVYLWKRVKRLTGNRRLWIRNAVVGTTSQLLDATLFFSLAFFALPIMLSGKPLVPLETWWAVMNGAWLYGLFKGLLLRSLSYPLVRLGIAFIRARRELDIPSLASIVAEEAPAR
ncbi:MAG: queuosine precursor transporter [Fimbriimonas sp.]